MNNIPDWVDDKDPGYEAVPLDDPGFKEFQDRRKIPMTLKDLIEEELRRDKEANK